MKLGRRFFSLVLPFLGIAGWSLAAWFSLHDFTVAGLDDWAYFAPAVATGHPFALTAPLNGNFLGADHTWGLHWPGAPLIYSILFSLFAWVPLPIFRVALFIVIWLALAGLTFRLVKVYLGSSALAGGVQH